MISWPWDSLVIGKNEETGFPIYDRGYKAEELRAILKMFFSDGVFYQEPASFTVEPGDGMSVLVSPGRCFIQGDAGVEVSTREIVFAAASSQPRIDTVVLRWDNNIDARKIDLYVVQGVASDVPVRPTLTRGETVWELGICDVFHPANATSVSADRITDTRLDDSRCGLSTPLMDVDTSSFFDQIQSAVDKAVELADSALDGTLAGNLQNQIDGKMGAVSDGEYYGIAAPDGDYDDWIRTTTQGLIPAAQGGASSLGTATWPFLNVYANNFYGTWAGNAIGIGKLSIPYISARGNAASLALTAGTQTVVQLNTTIAINGNFTFSGGGIRVGDAGKYLIAGSVYLSASGATGNVAAGKGVHIWNGNTEIHGATYHGQTGGAPTGPCIMSLAAGAVIYLKCRSISVAGTAVPNNNSTFLTIVRVG